MLCLKVIGFLSVSVIAVAVPAKSGQFVYTATPDQFTEKSSLEYFKEASDTHVASIDRCYRRINQGSKLQIVCTGTIESLIFGGHVSRSSISCLHNFELIASNNKYRTHKEPECTK